MKALRQAILGEGNRANTIMGICAVAGGILLWLSTGELNTESIITGAGMVAAGLGLGFSRGGGTGSDTPST
jgi:hypothetical protein